RVVRRRALSAAVGTTAECTTRPVASLQLLWHAARQFMIVAVATRKVLLSVELPNRVALRKAQRESRSFPGFVPSPGRLPLASFPRDPAFAVNSCAGRTP